VDDSGLYTAPNSSMETTVTVVCGECSDVSTITVTNHSPTVATSAAAEQVPATATISLSVLGADSDPTGEAGLTYTWTAITYPEGATISFSDANGDNDGKSVTATVDMLASTSFR